MFHREGGGGIHNMERNNLKTAHDQYRSSKPFRKWVHGNKLKIRVVRMGGLLRIDKPILAVQIFDLAASALCHQKETKSLTFYGECLHIHHCPCGGGGLTGVQSSMGRLHWGEFQCANIGLRRVISHQPGVTDNTATIRASPLHNWISYQQVPLCQSDSTGEREGLSGNWYPIRW